MANKKTNISVVLPVHELVGEENMKLFNNAMTSIGNQEVKPDSVLIVTPKGSDVYKKLKDMDLTSHGVKTTILENPGGTDFSSQVNYGVSQCKTEWFSILEFDDEYSSKWFKNVVKYKEAHKDVDVFMPIIIDVNQKDGSFMGLTNEAVWANSFSDELGVLDNNALLSFQNFNIDGITMKTEAFNESGGLKSNIKLTFIYEFLLRITFKDQKVMVIPKLGYKHLNQRPDSLFVKYKEEMDPVEANWWLAQAKKEYYFDNEREITYEETT
tara:strand:+ start:3837 stop:4643 length:807 start_codon:yes stop_codon:yes gene_type:complete